MVIKAMFSVPPALISVHNDGVPRQGWRATFVILSLSIGFRARISTSGSFGEQAIARDDWG